MKHADIEELKKIHEKYYPHDAFPNFDRLWDTLVITGQDGEIINAGGVELIAEGVLITNYDRSVIERGKALLRQFAHMQLTCGKLKQQHLHVFENADNETWLRALKAYGFESAGTALFKKV